MKEIVLKVQNLKKTFGKKDNVVNAINGISFNVHKGEIVGLLGPNGAGKTTTIKAICGLIEVDEGVVKVDNMQLKDNRSMYMKRVTAVFEGNRNIFWKLSILENIDFVLSLQNMRSKDKKEEIYNYLRRFDLYDKREVQAGMLSRGMQQKLTILLALLKDCNIILLDEPTLGLDPKSSYEIRKLISSLVKNDDRTFIITTHDMNIVQNLCDKVIIMNHGSIVANDKIDRLMNLFKARKYSINIDKQLTVEQKVKFNQLGNVLVKDDDFQNQIIVESDMPEKFYSIMDILKLENIVINNIDSQDLNFENIYMRIVEDVKRSC